MNYKKELLVRTFKVLSYTKDINVIKENLFAATFEATFETITHIDTYTSIVKILKI